jgi:AhpD family alkylhydroperoxidase
MGHNHDLMKDLAGSTRELREMIPDTWAGFAKMHGAAMAEGVLSRSTKELIALAISVIHQCDGCIAAHARAAARKGATPEEVAEAIGVTVLMGGGPSTIYGPRAWAAYQEFAAD